MSKRKAENYYGLPPKVLVENIQVDLVRDKVEMGFCQYLPIKMAGALENFHIPPNLNWIKPFIQHLDFDPHTDYIYVSAKHLFVTPDNMGNRPGWHSDGFGSDDVNFIWSDMFPTQFCIQEFQLTEDHTKSLQELEEQALPENIVDYGANAFVRIDRWNIHRPPVDGTGFRTFLKFSVSKNKYNLQGNSHNYLMNYDWEMVPRSAVRNHPTADTAGKVVEQPWELKMSIQLPGARNHVFNVQRLVDRMEELGVNVIPVRNCSIRFDQFTPDTMVSLEYIIRDLLLEEGCGNWINMNQAKPLLVDMLVATGLFVRVKESGMKAMRGRVYNGVPQKQNAHLVDCLWYVPFEKRLTGHDMKAHPFRGKR